MIGVTSLSVKRIWFPSSRARRRRRMRWLITVYSLVSCQGRPLPHEFECLSSRCRSSLLGDPKTRWHFEHENWAQIPCCENSCLMRSWLLVNCSPQFGAWHRCMLLVVPLPELWQRWTWLLRLCARLNVFVQSGAVHWNRVLCAWVWESSSSEVDLSGEFWTERLDAESWKSCTGSLYCCREDNEWSDDSEELESPVRRVDKGWISGAN